VISLNQELRASLIGSIQSNFVYPIFINSTTEHEPHIRHVGVASIRKNDVFMIINVLENTEPYSVQVLCNGKIGYISNYFLFEIRDRKYYERL
jgi:hypothetical protein